jgi:hypothetical protein
VPRWGAARRRARGCRSRLAQIEALRARGDPLAAPASEPIAEHPDLEAVRPDDLVRTLVDLRAASAATIRRGLRRPDGQLLPLALPILELLARDDVARDAALALARHELETASEGRARDARKLEHVFNVLSLTFPREAMQLAYGALVAREPFLRGVALEYLDAVLPADLRAALTPRLDSATVQKTTAPRPSSRALDDLLQSKETTRLNLNEIRRVHDADGECRREDPLSHNHP